MLIFERIKSYEAKFPPKMIVDTMIRIMSSNSRQQSHYTTQSGLKNETSKRKKSRSAKASSPPKRAGPRNKKEKPVTTIGAGRRSGAPLRTSKLHAHLLLATS